MENAAVVVGVTEPALIETTIGVRLMEAAKSWPDRVALISRHDDVRLTWPELEGRARALAAGLSELGIVTGDRVAMWGPNGVEWALTQFATAYIGAILVNLNPAYRTSETAFTLRKTGAKMLVVAERVKTSNYIALVEDMLASRFTDAYGRGDAFPELEFLVKIGGSARAGWRLFKDLPSADRAATDRVATIAGTLNSRDPINIQFTSGTTGTPKGATLSHRNILNNGYFVGNALGLTPHDRVCIPVPLYHCFGMVMGNLACLTHGATMVYPSATFNPQQVLEAVQAEQCTALYGVPTMFIEILQHLQCADYTTTSLRTGIMAGAPCPIEVMRQVVERLHMPDITIAYGMTETSPVSFQSSPDDPLDKRVETVGRVMPHLECCVRDANGAIVPRGVSGELCTRGYSVMLGYWDEPSITLEVLDADGWLHTGDLATIDDDGYCRIVGRIKDMIIRGGENVYPREVEEFLYSHPAVQDVALVGVPDAILGEELCAWIRVREGAELSEDAVRAFCVGRIAHFKIPKHIRFVTDFPLTATGKVQKFEIRRVMQADLLSKAV
jgi:fatty-acyl-CoA synthase